MTNMIKKKNDIIKKYGVDNSITYYYFSLNPIEYVGEEQVRKSFESVKKHGKNVIIGDYGSTDGIKELVEEYGFTFLPVEKTPGVFFHETKISNKIIKEATGNFICYLNFWIEYRGDLEKFIKKWLRTNDITKKFLKLTGYGVGDNGKIGKCHGVTHSVSAIIYRPYLLEARGFDERSSYHAGSRNYIIGLLSKVYGLKIDEYFFNFIHAQHLNTHWGKVPKKHQKAGLKNADERINKLSRDFHKEVKNIRNSYW